MRKQKTDRRDAGHILPWLMEDRFPRLWVPMAEQRDLRQLLIHRHRLVEIRTRVKNGLQHLALNRGLQKHFRLWSVRGRACLEELSLSGWSAQRRADVLKLLSQLDAQIGALDRDGVFFVTRMKDNTDCGVLERQPVPERGPVQRDEIIFLYKLARTGKRDLFLRRIEFWDSNSSAPGLSHQS